MESIVQRSDTSRALDVCENHHPLECGYLTVSCTLWNSCHFPSVRVHGMSPVWLSAPVLLTLLIEILLVFILVPLIILLLVSIYRVKTLHHNPIFVLSRAQVVLDLLTLLIIVSYDIPSTISEKAVYGRKNKSWQILRRTLGVDLGLHHSDPMVRAAFPPPSSRLCAFLCHLSARSLPQDPHSACCADSHNNSADFK